MLGAQGDTFIPMPPATPTFITALTTALLAVQLSAQTPAAEPEKFDLSLVWTTGHIYKQETDTETTTSLTALGQPADQRLFLKQNTSIQVTAGIRSREKTVLVTFDSMLGEMEQDGRRFLFDSARPDESHPLLRSTFSAGVGRSFVLAYNDKDEFLEVRESAPPPSAGAPVPELLTIAESREMADLFRRSLELGLPKLPVAVGDRWTSDETMPFPKAGKMKVTLNCKFEEIVERETRQHAKVIFQGKLASDLDEPEPGDKFSPQGSTSVLMGEGSNMSGQVFFDLERKTVSVAVFLANLDLRINGNRLPVRQQVTTRLIAMDPMELSDSASR
jgi:hypothetical protein